MSPEPRGPDRVGGPATHPSLLVVTGPPGAGKSTVARLLVERGPGRAGPTILVEGDAFFRFLVAGAVPPWRPESAAQNEVVIDATAAATGRFVAAGWPTVVDGIIGPWFLDRFLDGLGDGVGPVVPVDYVVLLPTVERCVERVAARRGHGFRDEAATRKMHAEFSRAAVAERHVLVTDGEAQAATTGRIEEARRSGDLRYAPEDPGPRSSALPPEH